MKRSSLALIFLVLFLFPGCDDDGIVDPQPSDQLVSATSVTGITVLAGKDVTFTLPKNYTTLNGSLSTATAGIQKYAWSKVSGPSTFGIATPTAAKTLIRNLVAGTYTFRLTVTDLKNNVGSDDVIVIVKPEDVFFKGNMDNVTITNVNSKLVFNGWDLLKSHPYVESLDLNNIGGTSYAYQKIQLDPLNSSRKAMYATILNDDPNVGGTTRAQTSIEFKDGVNLSVYHTSHRMYLSPDIGYLQNYSSAIYWFELFEIWNKHVDGWDGDVAGSARWSLYLNKESGAGQPLYWVMKAEYMQPANVELDDIWSYTNKQIAIPLGKWVTLDLYMKRGEGTNGKLTVTLTPDGGSPQVLFNIANTTVYPGHPEIQLKTWQPFKLYFDDKLLDWMKANGKQITANYNDFTWYKN